MTDGDKEGVVSHDSPRGIGPGNHTGTVRRIRFVDGQPQPPETMDTGRNFPDGIGVLEMPRRATAAERPTRTPAM